MFEKFPKNIESPLTFKTIIHQGMCTSESSLDSPYCSFWLPHLHRNQTKTIHVLGGMLNINYKNSTIILRKGQRMVIEKSESHSLSPYQDEKIEFMTTMTPGNHFERFLKNFYGILKDSKNEEFRVVDLIFLFKIFDEYDVEITIIPSIIWKINSIFTKFLSLLIWLPRDIVEYQ
jgi:hypothetical protein